MAGPAECGENGYWILYLLMLCSRRHIGKLLPMTQEPLHPAIEIRNLCKNFGTFRALVDINMTVAKGEKVVLCGPSGSGKSTLIRCINGLETHNEGQIVVNGTELTADRKALDSARATVGMVFQQFNLFPHLTILQNCALAPIRTRNMSRAEAEALAMRYLERVRIPEQAHKYPGQLSGGQQQRVAIARALCQQPAIMLFDEPTSSLDPEMVKEVLDTMRELAADGMTMICVTHEMAFARQVADRIVFMDGGQIKESASPEEFFGNAQDPRARDFLSRVLQH